MSKAGMPARPGGIMKPANGRLFSCLSGTDQTFWPDILVIHGLGISGLAFVIENGFLLRELGVNTWIVVNS
ncbi:MAG: hypothetical protein WAV95_19940 [Azonexus sp.]